MSYCKDRFRRFERYALITGAASGMGRLYAESLAEGGYCLILVDIDRSGLEEVSAKITERVSAFNDWRIPYKSSFRLLPVVQDLSLPESAARVSEYVRDNGCEVEILINNAGMFYYQDIVETSKKSLSTMLMVHDYTPVMLCREFLPDMIEKGQGYVLNVSSLAAWLPWPGLGMYSSTKRFMKDFSRALRIECRNTGVSVTTACFGAVDTGLFSLSPKLRKLAISLRVMISPEKAVGKALDAMFRKKKNIMPGLLNHIAKPIVSILPDRILALIYKQTLAIRSKV